MTHLLFIYFKNIWDIHKNLEIDINRCQESEELVFFKYTVQNPYYSENKSMIKYEESKQIEYDGKDSGDDKQIYVEKWGKLKKLDITLTFELVYFSFFVQTQKKTEKNKMKGFRVRVNISDWS